MSAFPYEPFDLSDIKTYPLDARRSKTHVSGFSRAVTAGSTVGTFLDSLPSILAARDLKTIAAAIAEAKRNGGGILWGLGGHVIKTGLARFSST